ncbi:MAG: NfeD family protein [Saccharofermentans sp.]|nr:NfeD family protein [Saccharofermentans sp.]
MDFTISMWIVWLILMVAFLIVEAVTLGITTVWCAAGCLVAAIMDLLGAPVAAQVIAMIIVSVVCFVACLIWIRPAIDAKHSGKTDPTNADRVIGKEGVVIKAIDPMAGQGQIKVLGQVWSAKADKAISEGAKVKVLSMEGVKLIVKEV